MHSTPIGPTGAAIDKPMMSPRSKKPMTIDLSWGEAQFHKESCVLTQFWSVAEALSPMDR